MKHWIKRSVVFCLLGAGSQVEAAPPGIGIASPVNAASFTAPPVLTLVPAVTNTSGTVTNVSFYRAGSTLIGSATASPFRVLWNGAPAGTHTLTAVAQADDGASATSAPVAVIITALAANGINFVPAEATWKYLDDGSNQGTGWRTNGFDDSGWSTGVAQLGYGDGDEVTTVGFGPDANNKYITTYFRRAFTVTNAPNITNLTVRVIRDDGAVVYLNGREVFRSNMDGTVLYNTPASGNTTQSDETTNFVSASISPTNLVNGTNLIAVEVHQNQGTSTDLSFDLELLGLIGAPNTPPVVNITTPSDGASFAAPATVAVEATASDAGGSVARVELYTNGVFVRTEMAAPYEWTLANLIAGSYALRAVAVDNQGAATTSAVVNITVTGNIPPTASITSPSGSATNFTAPASITVNANASDADGTVTNVEFYLGGTRFAQDATSPYSATTNGVPIENYDLTVVGTDNGGARTTSAVVRVTVRSNTPPVVAITSPANNAIFSAPATVVIQANATDFEGAVASVDFYQNGSLLNTDNSSPFAYTWNGVAVGGYALTAVATDGAGLATTSAPINITVSSMTPIVTMFIASNSIWRYLDNGSDQGTAWRGTGFNDNTWATGPAQLGFGDGDEATVVASNAQITTYFRRTFNVSDASSYTNLALWLLRDDGGVVHLNGTEIFRSSTAPSGTIAFDTPFTLGPDNEVDTTNIVNPGSLLVNGNNVLAVEIHQNTAVSSDISFDFQLVGTAPPSGSSNAAPSVSLTNPPTGTVFAAPVSIPLDATASDPDGTVGLVEFFANGAKIGEDVTSPFSYVWPNVPPGSYSLRAITTDNSGGTGTSAPVSITVTGAVNLPPSVAITAPPNGSTFQAPIELPVTVNASDPDGPVSKVEFFRGAVKVGESTVSPFNFTWTNALVGTFAFNAIVSDAFGATGTSAPVSITFTSAAPPLIFPLGSVWRFLDTGTDLGGAWTAPTFDDSAWNSGPGQLGYGDNDEATVVEDNPTPGYNAGDSDRFITTYFRRSFEVPNPAAYSFLQVIYRRDDGLVVHLNGSEVARNNMGGGAVSFSTPASTAGDDGNAFFTNTVSSTLLVAGTNVMAVEVHQSGPGSSDLSFDLALIGNTGAIVNNPPTVALTAPSSGSVFTEPANISLTAAASDPDGSIAKVEFFAAGAEIGEDTAAPFGFTWSGVSVGNYALSAVATDNLGASVTSSVVNVTVVPSTAPVLSARAPAPGAVNALAQITVSFSEPVDGVDATDLLINNVAASSVVAANGTNFTFTFPQLMDGVVSVAFAANHGIADRESPPKPFDATAPNASWSYTLTDNVVPTVVSITPTATATLKSLTSVRVTFSEAVSGVNASDLRVNGMGATSVTGSGAGPYTFSVNQPPGVNPLNVTVAWTNNHGIRDFAAAPNSFAGGSWSYVLNTNAVETNILITEIMYHPPHNQAGYVPEPTAEEYVEIHNRGATAVNLTGWRLSGGVSFAFPNMTLNAGAYLAIAANVQTFTDKYPTVTNVVGPWLGRLGNTDNDLDLDNALGTRIDSVHYADEGDWALRRVLPDETAGRPSIEWTTPADGEGSSLELVNTALPNQFGQNWAASTNSNGTPGRTNSVRATNSAPLILDVAHSPAVPTTANTVTITARLIDEQTSGLTARLWWRLGTDPFVSVNMMDNGLNGDGLANDGVFGVVLPAQSDLAVVEFYVEALDAGARARTWPAPTSTNGTQGANAVYQVTDEVYAGGQPMYRLVMTETDNQGLTSLNGSNPGSNAKYNTTVVTSDGAETRIQYCSAVRLRGAGSRGAQPPNLRVFFTSDRKWKGVNAVNLNTLYTHSQLAGSVISRKAGLASEEAVAVQVRRGGVNPANAGSPQFGSHIALESRDSDWAANHFPLDPNGNLYTCTRPNAGLAPLGSYTPGNIEGAGYLKDSNQGEADYSDIASLIQVMNAPLDGAYAANVRARVNVEQFLRYIAVLSLVGYGETSIGSDGQPDDYTIYRGAIDPRFMFFGHDHDTDFGQGDGSRQPPNNSVFRAGQGNNVINRFLTHPEFVPLYYRELKQQLETLFRPEVVTRQLDQAFLNFPVASQNVFEMKDWMTNRYFNVWSQIPTNLTVAGVPATVAAASLGVSGTAPVVETRSVRVNGQIASWNPVTGAWSVNLTLQPGLNRITVQALDGAGAVVMERVLETRYDDGSVTSVSGAISGGTTWTAAAGPYQITGTLTIGDGATLTIQPGTTVLINNGVSITVSGSGRLLAEGTENLPIRFTRQLTAGTTWGQIFLNGANAESRLTHAVIEYAGSSSGAVRADNSILYMDRVVYSNTAVQYVNVNASSFNIRRCVFPSGTSLELFHGNGLPPAGYGIIESNWFGTTTGLNDIIDFTGGQRPNAILQILNNTFTGASDDVLDLDGTDAHIEGNIFVNVHHDPGTSIDDTSSAISGGRDGANTSDLTIVRNLFFDVEHAVLAKEGNFYMLVNNTIVQVGIAAVNFGEPGRNLAGGAGASLDGNIIFNCPTLLENYTSAVMTVTVNRSIIPTNFPGTGNTNLNPQLASATGVTWQNIREKFALLAASPALATGPNGLDMGGLVPAGPSISGEPISPTGLTGATLAIDGPGITHYRHRLDGGVFGTETPVGTPITLSGLNGGLHQVFVIGKNSAGVYPPLTNASRPWIGNSLKTIVRINEVLARNDSAVPVLGRFPDLIELHNPGPSSISLAGMGVSDEANRPFKFTFPGSASIAAGAHLILYADSETTPAGHHLGFTLKQEGDEVFLTSSNGMLLDSVVFGTQLPNLSIGRGPGGDWRLSRPTLGAVNVRASLGSPSTLKINEWLASGVTPFAYDFIELFNPDSLPVDLGSLFLTDNPIGAPFLHDITPLSFIAGGGYAVFIADGNASAGADHVNFGLAAEQGMIALVASNGTMIDCVIYGPQTTDISMGRQPNGSVNYGFFTTPTPGAPNPSVVAPNTTVVINEVLALNINKTEADGSTPDWVEFYNPTASDIDLADMSLTDNSALPRKFVFPVSSTVPALSFRAIKCDPDIASHSGNAGFGLKSTGQSLYLFDTPANGGGQLSAVSFGVQAADFSIGRVPNGSTNWVLCAESIGAANVAAALGPAAALRINEWSASPSGCNNCDWFEIYNTSAQPVALGGLWLTDDLSTPATRMLHRIAPLSFISVNSASIGDYAYQRFEADRNLVAGPEHVDFALGVGGDQIGISTAAGALIDGLTFGAQMPGISEGRLPDGTANVTPFPGTDSPGDPNYKLLTNVVINEVLAHSDAPFEDAIEIRNLTGDPVSLDGWLLSDKKHDLAKYVIPTGVTLPPNGYRVFYETQFNDALAVKPFSLSSARGDEVYLGQTVAGAPTGYRAEISFEASENAVSFGRYTTSVGENHFVAMSSRTFGADTPDTVEDFRLGTGAANAYPNVGPIVISEIMYHPPDLEGGIDDLPNEYIELRNITGVTQPLYHPAFPTNFWRLRDAVSFTFPPNTSLPPNGLLLVVPFDPADTATLNAFRAKYNVSVTAAIYGPWSGQLANSTESVELVKPDAPQLAPDPDAGFVPTILVDKVKYFDVFPWPVADGNGFSLQRLSVDEYGNDPINWTAATPTPGPPGTGGDTDGDGMPDSWENLYPGLNPMANDANGDLDNDGMTNLEEYLAGTAPNDANSVLELRIVSASPTVLEFDAVAGKSYLVEYENTLDAASWTLLATSPAGAAGTRQIPDPSPHPVTRFYRVVTP